MRPSFTTIQSFVIVLGFIPLLVSCFYQNQMPKDFVKLYEVDPTIIQSQRYFGSENFLGSPVPGYHQHQILCTLQAANALKKANEAMKQKGYVLVVYDSYRPQRAVDAFIHWRSTAEDQQAKEKYYPKLTKEEIFNNGYIMEKSGHSRGSTFDLTLIPQNQTLQPVQAVARRLQNGEEILFLDDNTVDMGSSFDMFHPVSHHGTTLITSEQARMRQLLLETMNTYGFKELQEEWWHYTLKDEPYPNTYFDFVT